jgi:hypothetical protein
MQSATKNRHPYLVLLVLAWAAMMLPVTIADAAVGSKPAAVAKTVKQLKKQVSALQQQVAAIQGQATSPRPPGGPAGGDLAGVFPVPTIAPDAVAAPEILEDAVGTSEIAADSIIAEDLKANSVGIEEVAENAVGSAEIADGNVGTFDLDTESVGGRALKPVIDVIGQGVAVSAGVAKSTSVTCPENRRLIAGGFAWTDKEANTILASAPNEQNPNGSWVVEGMVDAGSNNLYAWATCLAY